MARKQVDRPRVIALFRSIQESFPKLSITLNTDPGNVDVSLDIPAQPGLAFDVSVNLQGDELHLNAGKYFWLEWFPCTDAGVEADFFVRPRSPARPVEGRRISHPRRSV